MPASEDVALGYKNVLEAERGFRSMTSTLELRPVYHRLEPRIRAHVRPSARSTAHRSLATLVKRGFAVQDEGRRYVPGPALSQPFSGPPVPGALRSLAHAHLVSLSRQVNESTHLMVRDGTAVRFLDSVEATQALRIGSRIGVVSPAHLSSGGKALLASLAPEEIESLYAADPEGPPLMELLRKLESVRRRGYALNLNESERGITAIGMCMRSADGTAIATISVSAPSTRLPRGSIPVTAHALRDSVRLVERDLGSM